MLRYRTTLYIYVRSYSTVVHDKISFREGFAHCMQARSCAVWGQLCPQMGWHLVRRACSVGPAGQDPGGGYEEGTGHRASWCTCSGGQYPPKQDSLRRRAVVAGQYIRNVHGRHLVGSITEFLAFGGDQYIL